MNDKQQVVDRLEGKRITILSEDIIYSEVHKKIKFMFNGFEFELDYWNKSDGEMGDYDGDSIIMHKGKDVMKHSDKFDGEFLEKLDEAVEDEVK